MKIREALEYTYVLAGAHGTTQALWEDAIIPAVNLALTNVYNYKGYLRSRQEYRENFATVPWVKATLQTSYPILNPKSVLFHHGPAVNTDDRVVNCIPCDTITQPWIICPTCSVACLPDDTDPLPLKYKSPQNKLWAGEYQVSWGWRLWGMWGKIIRIYTERQVQDGLYAVYQRWFNLIREATEELPIPDSFISAFTYMYAHFVIPAQWQDRQWDDTNFYNLAERELEYLKLRDNVFPTEITWMDWYEYYKKSAANVVPAAGIINTWYNTGKNML